MALILQTTKKGLSPNIGNLFMAADYLFLDDERVPRNVTWIVLPETYDWAIVRNYTEFVDWITKNGLPKFISFDHDLADEMYPDSSISLPYYKNGEIPYHLYKEKTGYHCAKWLIDYCMDNNKTLPRYTVHSLNTIGRENIKSLLESFTRFQSR